MRDILKLEIMRLDIMHNEFSLLLSDIRECEHDKFMTLFENIIEYAKDHFKVEEEILNSHHFYDTHEYLQGHEKTLHEMEYFYEKGQQKPMYAKAYINDYAFDKIQRHILSIDKQLKVFLKEAC